MCRDSHFGLFCPLKSRILKQNCRKFQYCQKRPGLGRQWKTHIAFSMFSLLVTNLCCWKESRGLAATTMSLFFLSRSIQSASLCGAARRQMALGCLARAIVRLPRTAGAQFKVKIPTIVPHYLYSGKGGWFLMLPPLPPRVLLLLCATTGLLCVLSYKRSQSFSSEYSIAWRSIGAMYYCSNH